MILPFLLTAAGVLAASGVAKLRDPAPAVAGLRELGVPLTRAVVLLTAVAELVGAALLVVRPSVGAPLAAALFALFAGVVALQLRAGVTRSCGCLGSAETPPSRAHVAVDLAFAAVCIAGAVAPATVTRPLEGVVLVVAAGATTWAVVAGLELLPRALTAYRRPAA